MGVIKNLSQVSEEWVNGRVMVCCFGEAPRRWHLEGEERTATSRLAEGRAARLEELLVLVGDP